MTKELTDITLQIHHETEKAFLFSEDGDESKAKWVPKSQIEVEHKGKGFFEVTMPIWLAKKNGWI